MDMQSLNRLKSCDDCAPSGEWIVVTTPYLDRHNDYLQVYFQRHGSGFLLTDDGYTIEDLERSGCKLDSPKRKKLLEITLNGFGVILNGNTMEVRATGEDFALRKHNLVQAMIVLSNFAIGVGD